MKQYLVVVPDWQSGIKSDYRIMDEKQIKQIRYYSDYITVYPLSSRLTLREKSKLGLKPSPRPSKK